MNLGGGRRRILVSPEMFPVKGRPHFSSSAGEDFKITALMLAHLRSLAKCH